MSEARMIEIETTRAVLSDIGELKDSNETLIPLGSGLYGRARITSKDILTEVGAGVMLKKGTKGASVFLDERKKDIDNVARQIDAHASEMMKRMNELGPELQRMAADIKKGQ